jgi:tetratricopeptide (TPR) repeat protein
MKMFARSLAAALLAGAALAAAPVIAKDAKPPKAEAPKPPKLSKPYAIGLSAAQKQLQAGDNAGAMTTLNGLDAVPPVEADDSYTKMLMTLNAAIGLKDNLLTEKTLQALLDTGRVSAEDQPKFLRNIGAMALNRKDYNAATGAFEKLVAMNPADSEAIVGLAELYFAQKQSAKAVDSLTKAIDAKKAAGATPDEAWYRRRLAIAYDGKQAAMVQTAAVGLVETYPNAVNWRDALVITRDKYPSLDDQTELDFLRLQAAANALNGERDFVEYADTALNRSYYGEAQFAINEGIRRNMLVATKPLVAELKKTADSKVAADKASLPGLEKESKTSPKLAMGTADAYYGYGEFAKAAALYKLGVGAAGVDQATANLRLGVALGRAGDKAGAMAALANVKGGAREELARYWMVFLNQSAPAA